MSKRFNLDCDLRINGDGQRQGAVTQPGADAGNCDRCQGAVVPGVNVLVTNTETNLVTNLTTNDSGFYLATGLVPGTYTVQFRAQGFKNSISVT